MEVAPAIGVGASDLQHVVRAEVRRIIKETKGNEIAQNKLFLGMLQDRGLVTAEEVKVLQRQAEVGIRAGAAKTGNANKAYSESRDLYNSLLTSAKPSPVALAIASSAVGSYETGPDGSGSVVYKKNSGAWQNRGATVGAAIGGIWGPGGAAIGAAVGGAVGEAVDECLD